VSPLILVCIVVALAIIVLVAFVAVMPLLKRNRPRR
jgi:energy-converting hydrogenase Eha subunit A